MDKNIKVSVVIPAYNAAAHIKKCLESIIKQTIFEYLEVIIVNDGSTDNTEKILADYSGHYFNIMFLTIPNGGVSNARNVGIQYAKGSYIAFLDADDWVDPLCYENMFKNAVETQADIVAAGFIVNKETAQPLVRKITEINHTEDNVNALKSFLLGILDVHVCDKLFRTAIVKGASFEQNVTIGEDRLFLMDCLIQSKRVSFMHEVFYHYYQNEQSAMHKNISTATVQCIDYVANQVKHRCSKVLPDLVPYAEAMYISDICRLYCDLCGECREKIQKNLKLGLDYKKEIKHYPLRNAIKYMSRKHLIALIIAKINPRIVYVLRKNTYLRFMK